MSPGAVVVARDAGAASALAPVVRALREEGTLRPEVVAWGHARAVFEGEGLEVRAFPEDPAAHEIEALFASTGAAVVATGTSLRAELDGRFWAAADTRGVPSLALLDHWKNYAERFTVETPFDVVPTVIAVMDDVAEGELVARGCPAERVRVTGQPRFDALPGAVTADDRAAARSALGVEPSRRVAVFASELRGGPYDDGGAFGQSDALALLLDGARAAGGDMLVLVKLHPAERADDTAALLADETQIETRVLHDCAISTLAAAADVFFGITSIVLLDAALLGVRTVSIRPGGGASQFVDTHGDLIATASTVGDVEAAFAAGPAGATARSLRGGTAAVCEQLQDLVAAARMRA